MELNLIICGTFCKTMVFKINGVDADYKDFGEQYDRDSENAEDESCGDMRFTGNPSTPKIIEKYKIKVEQEKTIKYYKIN